MSKPLVKRSISFKSPSTESGELHQIAVHNTNLLYFREDHRNATIRRRGRMLWNGARAGGLKGELAGDVMGISEPVGP